MDEEPHSSSVCGSGPGGLCSHRLRFFQPFFSSLSLSDRPPPGKEREKKVPNLEEKKKSCVNMCSHGEVVR